MKTPILFGRLGNKTNDIKYFKKYLPTDNKIIVEPFGGTFAVTRLEYTDDKYKKFVNDNDELLTKIYNNPEKYSKLRKDLNEIAKTCLNDNNQVDFKKFLLKADKYVKDNRIDLDLFNFWKKEKIIRGSMVKIFKNNFNDDDKIIENMKKIKFTCDDWENIVNKYKGNKDAFIFLDPPYLFSDNSQYSQQQRKEGNDMTDMIYKIFEILEDKKTKAKIMFIINDMKILRWLFKDYIIGDYEKIYQIGKRKDKHLIICNYKMG